MTGRVHVLTKSPDDPRHERCLTILSPGDTLVLAARALDQLTRHSPLAPIEAGTVLALTESADSAALPAVCEAIDYAAFVDRILTEHQPVFW